MLNLTFKTAALLLLLLLLDAWVASAERHHGAAPLAAHNAACCGRLNLCQDFCNMLPFVVYKETGQSNWLQRGQ